MAERIIILLAVGFACGYGIKQLLDGFNRKYFIVALCGMAALFFSRLYYLIIVLSAGNDEIMTVGVLGQASAYLFFMTANTGFLSREVMEKAKKKICVPGAVGSVIIASLFIITAVITGTVGAYIGELIYIFTMCGAFYISSYVITCRRENTASGAVYRFNICVCILTALNAFSELAKAAVPETVLVIILWALTVVCSVIIVLMMPVLRMGMRKWPQ